MATSTFMYKCTKSVSFAGHSIAEFQLSVPPLAPDRAVEGHKQQAFCTTIFGNHSSRVQWFPCHGHAFSKPRRTFSTPHNRAFEAYRPIPWPHNHARLWWDSSRVPRMSAASWHSSKRGRGRKPSFRSGLPAPTSALR